MLVMFEEVNRDGAKMGPVAINPTAVSSVAPGPYGTLLEPGNWKCLSSVIEIAESPTFYVVLGDVAEVTNKFNA